MAATYTNKATGIKVASGTIKSVAADGLSMVINTQEIVDGKAVPTEMTVKAGNTVPFDNTEYKAGLNVTAVGYVVRGYLDADVVMIGNQVYENEKLAVLTGFVKRVKYNEEKNEDGTPKMTRGTAEQPAKAKQPHFDITVTVKDEITGNYVDHRIKCYDNKSENGGKSNLDIAKALFSRFDAKDNRAIVSIVTGPGRPYSMPYTKKDGTEGLSHYSDHMGFRKLDVDFIDQREKNKEAGQAKAPTAPTASTATSAQETPAPAPAPTPAKEEHNGFDEAPMEVDEMEYFA